MLTIFDSARPVKFARPFGILPARELYAQADLDWATQLFGDVEAERWLEQQAERSRWDAQFDGAFACLAGCCQLCSQPHGDLTPQGLCDPCDLITLEHSFPFRTV